MFRFIDTSLMQIIMSTSLWKNPQNPHYDKYEKLTINIARALLSIIIIAGVVACIDNTNGKDIATDLFVVISPEEGVSANGVDSYTITVQLADEEGAPASHGGVWISFSKNTTSETSFDQASPLMTDENGKVIFSLNATEPGNTTILILATLSIPVAKLYEVQFFPTESPPGEITRLAIFAPPSVPSGSMAQVQIVLQDEFGKNITSRAPDDTHEYTAFKKRNQSLLF